MAARSAGPRRCRRAPAASPPVSDMNPVLLKPQSDGAAQIVLVRPGAGQRRRRATTATLAPSAAAGGAGRLRPARRRGRSRPRRGRRQPGRDQPARRRHRQYGLRRGRRRAGRADRRHRARRRHRAAGRHARAAVAGRARPDRRLYRQQVPRRCQAVRRRHRRDRRAHRAGDASASCRFSPRPRCFRPRIRWRCGATLAYRRLLRPVPRSLRRWRAARAAVAEIKIAVPRAAAHRQFRRSRPAARRAGGRARHGPAGPSAAARRRARDPARIEGDAVRSRLPAARGLGHRHPRASPRRAGMSSGLCGGYQMLGRRIADPDGREGPPGEAAGLGLLDIDTVLGRRQAALRSRRHRSRDRHARCAATRCISA